MNYYNVDIKKLDSLSIYQLRDVAAKVGVRNPTAQRSKDLRASIRDVVTGKTPPYHKSKSGRPHKEIISDDEWDDLVGFNNTYNFCTNADRLTIRSVSSKIYPRNPNQIYEGYVVENKGELLLAIGTPDQLHINAYAVIALDTPHMELLLPGDRITATLSPYDETKADPIVTSIKSINGSTDFDALIAQRISHTPQSTQTSLSTSTVDTKQNIQFSLPQLAFLNKNYPIKIGSRAFFVGDDQLCGQDYLANSIAKDLSQNYKIVYLSCKKMPEHKMTFANNVEYFFSTFDVIMRDIVFAFELAFSRAKLLSETNHTIFIIDDLIDVMQAYYQIMNLHNGTNDASEFDEILQQIKTIYASSGIKANGSLTVFAFASISRNQILSDYLHTLGELANCYIMLDKTRFLRGDDEFLINEKCYILDDKRTLA